MVACKSLREYNNNKEKVKKILFRGKETNKTKTITASTRTKHLSHKDSSRRERTIRTRPSCSNGQKEPRDTTTKETKQSS